METRALRTVPGYDPKLQPRIAFQAAQLDDQLRRLIASVSGLTVEALEWQPEPGRNTVGMLLAHMAVAEAWWIAVSAEGIEEHADSSARVRPVLGIGADDDGMPLAAGGGHPQALRGWELPDYLGLLEKARATTHRVLRGWPDERLEESVLVRARDCTRGWILYHLLEHFVAHYGQVLVLLRTLRERGVVSSPTGIGT